MPTYEYLCHACSHRFETWQKMTDEPLTVCPECGGHIRRVLYPAGIVFKGSGFYKTDYGKGSGAGSNGSNGSNGDSKKAEGSSDKAASSESKSSESKPSENGSSSTTASESKAAANSGTK